tara:strand:+ start:282 stop:773 length:492 start_codon:yes stop_codon:yes gene_type:complete
MILKIKNKDKLVVDDFIFKCSIGKNGVSYNKTEGDGKTPKGEFGFGDVYWRADRIKKPETKLKCKKILKDAVWCDDPESDFYNKEVKFSKKYRFEKLYRRDKKYDIFLVIKYNRPNIVKYKGSAIFLHLTKNYKKTAGCIAIKKNDMLIVLKLLKRNSKIIIS